MAAVTFPRSRDLGGGVVAWFEAEVLDWIDEKPVRRGTTLSGADAQVEPADVGVAHRERTKVYF